MPQPTISMISSNLFWIVAIEGCKRFFLPSRIDLSLSNANQYRIRGTLKQDRILADHQVTELIPQKSSTFSIVKAQY